MFQPTFPYVQTGEYFDIQTYISCINFRGQPFPETLKARAENVIRIEWFALIEEKSRSGDTLGPVKLIG